MLTLQRLSFTGWSKNQTMLLPDHCNSPRLARDALVLGPSAALNRDPTTTSGVNNSSQIIPQLCVPQQFTASQPPRLVSRSGQLQEQGFSVEVAERIASPLRSSTRTIYKSKWALFVKWCRENSVDFSTPSVKQISDFFMYPYQDLNRCPSTIDGDRTAIVDTLGPAGPPYCTKFWPSQVILQFSQGSSKKFQKSSKMEPFCCSQWAHKSTLWAYERHRPQTSYSQNCFLASFGLWQAPQRNPCLGYKQSI